VDINDRSTFSIERDDDFTYCVQSEEVKIIVRFLHKTPSAYPKRRSLTR